MKDRKHLSPEDESPLLLMQTIIYSRVTKHATKSPFPYCGSVNCCIFYRPYYNINVHWTYKQQSTCLRMEGSKIQKLFRERKRKIETGWPLSGIAWWNKLWWSFRKRGLSWRLKENCHFHSTESFWLQPDSALLFIWTNPRSLDGHLNSRYQNEGFSMTLDWSFITFREVERVKWASAGFCFSHLQFKLILKSLKAPIVFYR